MNRKIKSVLVSWEAHMANVQTYFEKFHDEIKLDDENKILREKRDILIDKLKKKLKDDFDEPPCFTHFNKGGYAMGLGVKPLDSDYDIDVGLEFEIKIDDYPDPVDVKEWVYNALNGHTDKVTIKKPCVTVQYHINKEPVYHVDFAVYGKDGITANLFLARGKPTSPSDERKWEFDDPKGLMKIIQNKFSDENDRKQFRRIIRYLKRWKDYKFSSDGYSAPIGIGLTVCAYSWLGISKKLIDPVAQSYEYNDLDSISQLVKKMISNFNIVSIEDDKTLYRLEIPLPVQPFNDLFKKMTDVQMTDFKKKLESLRDSLDNAQAEIDPVEACKELKKQFGDDFPIPDIKETGQKRGPSIISSSSAG